MTINSFADRFAGLLGLRKLLEVIESTSVCFVATAYPVLENKSMKNKGRFLYVLTGVLAMTMPVHAHAETMREAVQTALSTHPAIDVAKARHQGTREDESEQYSDLFPQIQTTATGGRVFGDNATSRGLTVTRGAAYSWLWEGSASLTQPIFNGFETYNRIDAAAAREKAAEFTLADTRQTIALQAGMAYLNVLRAKEALEKTRSYKDRIADYLTRITSMVDSGAADEAESAQARNIQAMLENSVAEMEGQVKSALADYAESTGSVPKSELQKAGVEQSLIMKTSDEAISYADQYHPLILSAQKEIEAEDNEISAERGTLLPDLNGELSYLKRDQKEEIGGEATDARAVMRMNWGFSTGGAQLARIRKSKAERSEAIARAAQTQRSVERDIRRAYAEYETASKQDELNVKRVTIARELFETYERQFEASRVRLLQLMQAENQLFSAELERINSSYRVAMAELTTLASSGRLLSALNVEDAVPVVRDAAATTAIVRTPSIPDEGGVYPVQPTKALEENLGATPAGK